MKQAKSAGNRSKVFLDLARLRALVYQLGRKHDQLRRPLIRAAAAGSALAANTGNFGSRHEAREAWQALLDVIELHMSKNVDEQLLESAEKLSVVPDQTAQALLKVCGQLKQLETRVSGVDLEKSPPEELAAAGEAMRKFAVTLDDLALREDREVLPQLQHLLYPDANKSK
ncbi:MAG TPA: hypothetical protein VMA09_08045 [Candidatus Binataceae bacterium]|nr:hypothetical protein [Candidatus Binataceae bacterium]